MRRSGRRTFERATITEEGPRTYGWVVALGGTRANSKQKPSNQTAKKKKRRKNPRDE